MHYDPRITYLPPCRSEQLRTKLSIPATYLSVRTAVMTVDTALHQTVSQSRRDTIQLVLAELLNNVVAHAYGGECCEKIDLLIRLRPAHVLAEIKDRGREFQHHARKLPCADTTISEGGRGRLIVSSLVTKCNRSRDNGVNTQKLCFDRDDGHGWGLDNPQECTSVPRN